MARKPEEAASQEGAPRFKIEAFSDMRGKRLGEVNGKARAQNAAGEAEIRYILANPDSKEARKLKDGNAYFFFGAADGGNAPFLYWGGVRFNRHSGWLDRGWYSYDRAVLRD